MRHAVVRQHLPEHLEIPGPHCTAFVLVDLLEIGVDAPVADLMGDVRYLPLIDDLVPVVVGGRRMLVDVAFQAGKPPINARIPVVVIVIVRVVGPACDRRVFMPGVDFLVVADEFVEECLHAFARRFIAVCIEHERRVVAVFLHDTVGFVIKEFVEYGILADPVAPAGSFHL